MRKIKALIGLLFLATLSYGHEFWLAPARFVVKKNEQVAIHFLVGEDYKGEHVNGRNIKITKLDHYFLADREDIKNKVSGDSLNYLNITFSNAGSNLITFNNSGKIIELEADKFNDYLKTEGLDNIVAIRQKSGDMAKPGKELFQRCAKTLIQVEGKNDSTYKVNTGMRLEIIPGKNPYSLKSGDSIDFKILFDNEPLENGLVLVWHTENNKTVHTATRTNSKGEITCTIATTGKWMVSVVNMIANTDNTLSDWQSFWGSYTWGYF